ncbi:MAG: DNA methyltransferase [Planctomycetota bacterium]
MTSKKQRSKVRAAAVADDDVVLSVLNELAGDKAAGQQREPAWPHPFPARLPISVAKHLVRGLTGAQSLILDPMMGSGTTLIAAKECGRPCIGFDRDLLAQRIARSATASYTSKELEELGENILDRADEIHASKRSMEYLREGLLDEDIAFLKFWFSTKAQKELFAFRQAIQEIDNDRLQNFAWVVFSSLIIAKSAGASFALDISRSRPHKVQDKPIAYPFEMWSRRFNAAVKRTPFVDATAKAKLTLGGGDAREVNLKDSSVDFILTSPPYRNAVDYLRSHKFSLVWMGTSIPEVRDLRGTMIGSERGLFSLDGIPDALEDRLARIVSPRREQAMTRRYLSDLRKAVGEMKRVLRPGGLAVMVVGPTMINAKKTDAADVLSQIAEHAGLRTVGSSVRVINPERRSLPAPSRVGATNFLAARMRREVIVAFRK